MGFAGIRVRDGATMFQYENMSHGTISPVEV